MPSLTISYLCCQDKIRQRLAVFQSLWLCLVDLLLSPSSQWHLYGCSRSHKWLWFHWIKIHLCLFDTSRQRGNTFSPHNGSEAAEKPVFNFLGMFFATSWSSTLGIGYTEDFILYIIYFLCSFLDSLIIANLTNRRDTMLCCFWMWACEGGGLPPF